MTPADWRRAKRLGLLRRPAGVPLGRDRGRGARRPARGRRAGHVQDRRHLRRRVRRRRRRTTTRPTRTRTRSDPSDRPQDRHPRVGAQPHRAGHRVRLLLRARQLRPARRRLRDGHGQLQPRDGLHRLRHQRPPLLRAAHLRGRDERHRGRAARSASIVEPRRPDAAQAGRPAAAGSWSSARRPSPSTWPRTASGGTRCAPGSRSRSPRAAPPATIDARARHRRAHRLPGAGAPVATCSAGGPWRSSTTRRACAGPWPSWPASARWARRAACRPSGRCSSTGSSRTPSRSTSTRCATPPARSSSAGSWSTSRRRACTRATAPA